MDAVTSHGASIPMSTSAACTLRGPIPSTQQAHRSLEDLLGRGVHDEVWAGWKLETSADAHDCVVFWSDGLRHLMSFSDQSFITASSTLCRWGMRLIQST
ncbi:hypothetical protein G6O67_006771 [Ophiocordyceps sinensis]|uniref:Uncharacterized protein n=1 Tax=Ophiocordyceps sinensis TaxID=72228 RepID=A0A8H4LXE3_9HYPO|nr:hypothetical protein G6O67_006771 [Ophiocordyceps sinensis]